MADKYVVFLEENTKDIDTVCELGAGVFKNFANYKCETKIGIEIVPAYVKHRQYAQCEAIIGDALKFEEFLEDKEIDAFACIDFIEHLEKDVAIDLIKRMQAKANRIFIYTPHGTCNMDGNAGSVWSNEGAWGGKVGEDRQLAIESQRHKSTWFVDDLLQLDFAVDRDAERLARDAKPTALYGEDGGDVIWAVWNKDKDTPLPVGYDKASEFKWRTS